MTMIKPPKVPCGSCPYRRDVPAGIWEAVEYDKLPLYDGETWNQSPALFLCHQQDDCLCGGWLATHGTDDLLALRFAATTLDPSVWSWTTDVPVFGSGAEAAAHGRAGIAEPTPAALRKIDGLIRKRSRT